VFSFDRCIEDGGLLLCMSKRTGKFDLPGEFFGFEDGMMICRHVIEGEMCLLPHPFHKAKNWNQSIRPENEVFTKRMKMAQKMVEEKLVEGDG